MIALVDVNNFYVSCERLFNPKLLNKPVVVLSNNDGCIISRSNEAKLLGIKMGTPLFKIKSVIKSSSIIALSSNYSLYADISNRTMILLASFSPQQEIYSIDECFLDLSGNRELNATGQIIKKKLWQYLDMPVCVGIAPTKTLAKLANYCAKKQPKWSGVCDLSELSTITIDNIMSKINVSEVWGVGNKTSDKLNSIGIYSVLDLKKSDAIYMKKKFNINLEKIIYELNKTICFPIESKTPLKKQIVTSRSFGRPIQRYNLLVEAITTFTARSAYKSRQQDTLAEYVSVFISSSPFQKKPYFYQNIITLKLPYPTSDTNLILSIALEGAQSIYKANIKYVKCGIILSGLADKNRSQDYLWPIETVERSRLTQAIDTINFKFDKQGIRLATQPINPIWKMKQSMKSQSFTTSWKELLVVN
jgi:DNA polymerase V